MPPLPLVTLLSAIAAIAAALLGPGYAPWLFVFKPLTTLLVIAHASRRGRDAGARRARRFVLAGLALSLAGDIALLWPREGFLPGLIAFLIAHLAYIAAFCVPLRLAARPWVFVAYAAVAVLILSQLWPGIPAALHAPVVAYVLCLATMAAQAAAWWRRSVALQAADLPLARRAAVGGMLFMVSDSLLATDKFAWPLPLAAWWVLATYWLAQWAIASSLPPPRPARPQGS